MAKAYAIIPAGHGIQEIRIPTNGFAPGEGTAFRAFFHCFQQKIIRFCQRNNLFRHCAGYKFLAYQKLMCLAELQQADYQRFTNRFDPDVYCRGIDDFAAVFRMFSLIPNRLAC